MAHIRYVSRSRGIHDRAWVDDLVSAGHEVEVRGIDAASGPGPVDLYVAGPLTDAAVAAVDAGRAPVLAIAWAFDVLVEMSDSHVHDEVLRTLPACAGVHVDCAAIRRAVLELGVDPDRISQAPWGIDSTFFSPGSDTGGLRAEHGLGSQDVVVLSTRSWEPLYDVPTVVEGVARARHADPRIRLVLVGDGSMAEEVRDRVRALGLDGCTVMTGRLSREALRDWLRAADVYVAAATSDGTSLSLLEAHSCGLPVVVPDLGGNPEWVDGPELGSLFHPRDPEALATALLDVVARGSTPQTVATRRDQVVTRGDRSRTRPVFLEAVERALGGGS